MRGELALTDSTFLMIPSESGLSGAACKSILLADDEERTRGVLAEALRARGYEVIEVEDGDNALATLRENASISLVIADNGMPGAAWKEIARAAENRMPPAKILLISGYSEHALRERGEFLAGFPFLAKPFSLREFVAMVQALCDPAISS